MPEPSTPPPAAPLPARAAHPAPALLAALAAVAALTLAACTSERPAAPEAPPLANHGSAPAPASAIGAGAAGAAAAAEFSERQDERDAMVAGQIAARGVRAPRVLAALRRVPRHAFVPASRRASAYDDRPLPIGEGQTISQPYIVALMTEAAEVEPGDKVLEVGTGSGYQAAVLAEIASDVRSIELLEPLASRARAALDRLGYGAVRTRVGDGYKGWPDAAPFDAILVTAAPPEVPPALVEQLAKGGRLVLPVGPDGEVQTLVRLKKREDGTLERSEFGAVRFVPLVPGEERR
jgi:protein-L-isoaspartate(D-aspartate) O-methyltransferase